jgi:hypothetical protein
MIWRRLLLRADRTLANLHHAIQIAFGWSDFHLHRFRIHGRDHGVNRVGGLSFSGDVRSVRLADFQFRPDERFLYDYDFGDGWQHLVRVERRLPLEPRRTYPVCVDGRRAALRKTAAAPWHSWDAETPCLGRSASTWSGSLRGSRPAIARPSAMSWRRLSL